jgi:hypothetical protein
MRLVANLEYFHFRLNGLEIERDRCPLMMGQAVPPQISRNRPPSIELTPSRTSPINPTEVMVC